MTVDWIILTYGVTKYDSRYNKGIHISEFAVYDVFVSKHKSHPYVVKVYHIEVAIATSRGSPAELGNFTYRMCKNFYMAASWSCGGYFHEITGHCYLTAKRADFHINKQST